MQLNLSHFPGDTVHVRWFGNDFGILRAWCYVLCWTCALSLPTHPVMWGNCVCGNLLCSQPTCSSTQHRPDWLLVHAVHTWSLQTQVVLQRVNEARDLLIFPFITSKFTLITYSFQLHCPCLACLVRNKFLGVWGKRDMAPYTYGIYPTHTKIQAIRSFYKSKTDSMFNKL